MKNRGFRIITNDRGSSIISTLIAAGIIVGSIAVVVIPAMKLQEAMRKTEVSNVAIIAESELISAFHNKDNYPEGSALSAALRAGTLPTAMTLTTSFGAMNLAGTAGGNYIGATGYLNREAAPCTGFDYQCVVKYEVRMGKPAGSTNFAFTYQISTNPSVSSSAPIGKLATYTATPTAEDGFSPIDPGLFRVGYIKNICDASSDIFMNGMNRDTGEAYCVAKPTVNKCPDGTMPTGLTLATYPNGSKAGTLELQCTTRMRTMSCPTNYSLEKFDPKYADPRMPGYSAANPPGRCVFRTATSTSTMPGGSFPPDPRNPYRSQVQGTFCPPYYKTKNPASCGLVPNETRNAGIGSGLCADTAYKNCTRSTWRDEYLPDGGAAYNTWVSNSAFYAGLFAIEPYKTIWAGLTVQTFVGTAPANPTYNWVTTCSRSQTSLYCDGNVTNGVALCPQGEVGAWSTGNPYAVRATVHVTSPTAASHMSFVNRTATCTFTDTSTPCDAPAQDFNGAAWGKKNPKWYGGVQVSNVGCELDPALVSSPTVPAVPGG